MRISDWSSGGCSSDRVSKCCSKNSAGSPASAAAAQAGRQSSPVVRPDRSVRFVSAGQLIRKALSAAAALSRHPASMASAGPGRTPAETAFSAAGSGSAGEGALGAGGAAVIGGCCGAQAERRATSGKNGRAAGGERVGKEGLEAGG